MSELIEMAFEDGRENMVKAIDHLKSELMKVRTGKASTSILKDIMLEYYGNPTPLSQVANLSTPDSKTISIQPWEKSMLGVIEQAIFASNLGLTPMNDGEFVRISIPPLTEERRREMVKYAKHLGEETKISLRNERHKMLDVIKSEVKDGYPEDQGKRRESEVQDIVNKFGEDVNKLIEAKEKDIMTV
ncbi:MAG: ribosome recycling factor [Saprospiraceae bacterium]|nr:ribosome recycling factor [Saprospiraceae bacterium]